jgi:hypothetical protein
MKLNFSTLIGFLSHYQVVAAVIIITIGGIFVAECTRTPFQKVLSQKDATWNGIPEPSFPGIGITNLHLRRNFGHSMRSRTFSKKNSTMMVVIKKKDQKEEEEEVA